VTLRVPGAAAELLSVLIVHVLIPRVAFHVQATETLSLSGSLVVVEACSTSFVFGEAGLKLGVVALGGELTMSVKVPLLLANWVGKVSPA
jgi:hypothetical protein